MRPRIRNKLSTNIKYLQLKRFSDENRDFIVGMRQQLFAVDDSCLLIADVSPTYDVVHWYPPALFTSEDTTTTNTSPLIVVPINGNPAGSTFHASVGLVS